MPVYVVDLFCGLGGFSVGAELTEDCRVLACFDLWKAGLAMHQLNSSARCDHFLMELGGDVNLFANRLKQYIATKNVPFEQVHFHASPPCQTFSILNTRRKEKTVADRDDAKTNLLYWTLDLFKALNPASWSVEQVPTALKHLRAKDHWVLSDPDVRVYGQCLGKTYGVPTLRARLYLCKNTELLPKSKRKRDDLSAFDTRYGNDATNPFVALSEELGTTQIAVRTETETMKIAVHENTKPHDKIRRYQGKRILYVRCQPEYGNELTSVHEVLNAITCQNVYVYYKTGESTVEHNDAQSYAFVKKHFDERNVTIGVQKEKFRKNCKTYAGVWTRLRGMNHTERLFVQGFPTSFKLDAGSTTLVYFTDLEKTCEHRETVKINSKDKLIGVGNAVIPLIAKHIVQHIRKLIQ